MFEVIFVTLLVTIALGGTIESKWGSRNYKEDYYISYTDHDGNTEEALLSNPGDHKFKVGDKIRIKFLPDRPEYHVLVEIL